LPPDALSGPVRSLVTAAFVIPYFAKVFATIFILLDDAGRLLRWIGSQFNKATVGQAAAGQANEVAIPRSAFLMKTALVAGAVPLVGFTVGILSGAHDYRIRRVRLPLKNLPNGFDGLRIAQLSDIHSGSFFNKTAVRGGVEMLLREKPDLVFFTGDLVNSYAKEVNGYIDVFDKVKAPLGVFSTLGNHDYSPYVNWVSPQAQQQNLCDVMAAHKQMGWNLLLDETRLLTQSGDNLALIGVQNLGFGAAALKAGDLAKAHRGAEAAPVKLLLSHDPTHWDAEVRPRFPDIDVTFSGHTHGAQSGVEIGDFRWSPAQYFYKQWAGLYQEGDQRLYVNRGFGYIGYPGRIGILPEITIFELVRA
jgi:uncharacterized protein